MWPSDHKIRHLHSLGRYRSSLDSIKNVRTQLNALAQTSNVHIHVPNGNNNRIELYNILPRQSSTTIRLVGLDLEFFKNKKKVKLPIPAQIGFCYYDIDLETGAVKNRVDVLENVFIEQTEETLREIDWQHAGEYVKITNPNPDPNPDPIEIFKQAQPKISFAKAMYDIINVCENTDFYFVGHSIDNDIFGMKLYVDSGRIIDTAPLFKSEGKTIGLRALAADHLKTKIQEPGKGHPPLVDAYTAIDIVIKLMKNKISLQRKAVPANSTQTLTHDLEIPETHIGKLIGKGGANIQSIRDTTKAKIVISDTKSQQATAYRIVTISSDDQQKINHAVTMIENSIKKKS